MPPREEPFVRITDHGDGSAKITVRDNGDSHRFNAVIDSAAESATLTYEETLSDRGAIDVTDPPQRLRKRLVQSERFTEWLDRHGIESVSFE